MNRLPAPFGDCVHQGKTDDYIYQDKEYSTEVSFLKSMLNFVFRAVKGVVFKSIW
jgi:hypothetical protein